MRWSLNTGICEICAAVAPRSAEAVTGAIGPATAYGASGFRSGFGSVFGFGSTPTPPIPRVYACCRACIASRACCVMLCGVFFLRRFAPAMNSCA